MSELFRPIRLRGTTFRNRVWASSMCQYSAVDGVPDDWHLVHLGAMARGGAGLVLTEATAVSGQSRISPVDTGIWNDAQTAAWRRTTDFVRARGAVPGDPARARPLPRACLTSGYGSVPAPHVR